MADATGMTSMTSMQLYQVGQVYDLMARLLPTEGRDYSIKFSPDDGGGISVSFRSYTEIGRVWCEYCTKVMGYMKESKGATK